MDVYEDLSSNTIKAICEYINGDYENCVFQYRTGSQIVENYRQKLKISGLVVGASRWTLTEQVIHYFSNENKLDYFFNIMFSIRNIRKDNSMSTEDECAILQEEAFRVINSFLLQDDYEFVKLKGKYTLRKVDSNLEPIGKGGFAEVYKNIDNDVVVKKLKDEYKSDRGVVSRFKKEFELTKNTLSDIEGIIEVYEYNANDISYTMEYIEQDLKHYIENNNLLKEQKLALIKNILLIMNNVHSRDVIHRDLSPKNIFIKDGNPIIADFGLGKDLNVLRSHQTYDTSYQGTLEYCDPRQLRSLSNGDKQSDIYSLGRIINFIMTKDPNDFNHDYRIPATKSTSDDINVRYKNINELIKDIDIIVNQVNTADYDKKCTMYIKSGKYFSYLDNYLISFKGTTLAYKCDEQNFRNVFYGFLIKPENEQIIVSMLNDTNNALRNERLAFKFLDGFGDLMVRTLAEPKISPNIKTIAGEIVEYIGYYINRYEVQNTFDSYYNDGRINPIYVAKILEYKQNK